MSNDTTGDMGSGDDSSTSDGFVSLQPSLPLCIALSAFGGLLEVSSTMVLAYPEHKAKLGKTYSTCQQRVHMIINLLLMGVASVAYIIGSWFGPVSLSVPTVMVSKLMFNLIIIGVVLRMDTFSKNQRVGTYCIACAILTLPEIGPAAEEGQDIIRMVQEPGAIVWIVLLFIASIFCCVMMGVLAKRTKDGNTPSQNLSLLVYVTAQVTSAVVGTSASKMFALTSGAFLYTLIVIAVLFAVINVVSLILAATAVDQGIFVPMQTCATLVTNLITGLIVWEEYKVIDKWIAYIMVHLIMLLGIWLLSPEDAIQQYKAAKQFHPDVATGMAKGEDYETINRRMSVRQSHAGCEMHDMASWPRGTPGASMTNDMAPNASFSNCGGHDQITLSLNSLPSADSKPGVPPLPSPGGGGGTETREQRAYSRQRGMSAAKIWDGATRGLAVSMTDDERDAWKSTFVSPRKQSFVSVPKAEMVPPPGTLLGEQQSSMPPPRKTPQGLHAMPSTVAEEQDALTKSTTKSSVTAGSLQRIQLEDRAESTRSIGNAPQL